MAIMVMATLNSVNKSFIYRMCHSLLLILLLTSAALAGEWIFEPNLNQKETYTDNIELTKTNQKSSLVSQFIVGIDSKFTSKKLSFSFTGSETLTAYSHDSKLNNDFQAINAETIFSLWEKGPQFIAISTISNISKNELDNSLADLISANTVQQIKHSAGIQYKIDNNSVKLNSAIIYNMIDTEDNIGESQGYLAALKAKNGSSARSLFWQMDAQFSDRKNKNLYLDNYTVKAKLGYITDYKINPFVRFYNEEFSGNVQRTNQKTTPSWGPGLSWSVAKKFIIDVSYNYLINDIQESDDYLATSIEWLPSPRTSVFASHSQRFFGDSYMLDFSHRTKRLENKISYHETIEVFDRNTYLETVLGTFWCPLATNNAEQPPIETEDCFITSPKVDNYQLVTLRSIKPIDNNEFTLNKRLTWQSALNLARTDFLLKVSNRQRKALTSLIIDNYLNLNFSISRQISTKSKLSLAVNYKKNIFDNNKQVESRQKDIYKMVSCTYNRKLTNSLKTSFTLRYLDRESNRQNKTYHEARASINITKDF